MLFCLISLGCGYSDWVVRVADGNGSSVHGVACGEAVISIGNEYGEAGELGMVVMVMAIWYDLAYGEVHMSRMLLDRVWQ